MLEEARLEYRRAAFLQHGKIISEAILNGNTKRALRLYGGLQKHSQKYQELHKRIHGTEDLGCAALYEKTDLLLQLESGKITKTQFAFQMSLVEGKYKPESKKKEEELRKEVRREFIKLGTQLQVVGQNPGEFVAGRAVDVYRIAKDRLNKGEKMLRLIYVDNPAAPQAIRKIMGRYVKGEISKEETSKQLTEREEATKGFLGEMKIKTPESKDSAAIVSSFTPFSVSITNKTPTIVFHKQLTPRDELNADIIADSMTDKGEVDKRQLFLNVSEITTLDEWAGLAKKLNGREPTPDELVSAMVRSYKTTYAAGSVPDAFKNVDDFQEWFKAFSGTLWENKTSLYDEALPAYHAVVESLSKKK